MGEQSTSMWTVDSDPVLVWTGQVERRATRGEDTAALATTKAQPESASQQSSVNRDMTPRTRSQTARSRPPGPSSDNLDVQSQAISLRDDGIEPHSVEESSEISPTQKSPEVRETRETPRSRKRAIDKGRREAALKADPNEGRCLITNLGGPTVQLCHLVPVATSDKKKKKIITQLEYVWEMGYNQLNVDTRYNILYLRVDWHFLFDQEHWTLVPEHDVLRELRKIYLDDKHATCNVEKLFEEKQYRYYFLPAPTLQDPICRFPEAVADNPPHETHFPPFSDFKWVESHVHPHFVIFNTGKKLASLKAIDGAWMQVLLCQRVSHKDNAISMFLTILELYEAWTTVQVPDHFSNAARKPHKFNTPSEAEDRSQRGPSPRRERLRSATRSRAQGSGVSGGRYARGQRAFLPFQQSDDDDDDDSVTDDTVMDDDTDWIEYIHNWQKQGTGVAERLESDISDDACDEQLAAYSKEHARTPPSPAAWDRWRPEWVESDSRYLTEKDRARFSSNDWALFNNDVYLTRPNYP